jgi:hypothetical protein
MITRLTTVALLLATTGFPAVAQEPDESQALVLKVGPAVEYETNSREKGYGAAAALETGILRGRLATELGISAIAMEATAELGAVLLLKLPFTLSERAELMLTAGPSLSRAGGETSSGAVFGMDLMFWPRPLLGWYIETSYGTDLKTGGERTVGVSTGLLLRIR